MTNASSDFSPPNTEAPSAVPSNTESPTPVPSNTDGPASVIMTTQRGKLLP